MLRLSRLCGDLTVFFFLTRLMLKLAQCLHFHFCYMYNCYKWLIERTHSNTNLKAHDHRKQPWSSRKALRPTFAGNGSVFHFMAPESCFLQTGYQSCSNWNTNHCFWWFIFTPQWERAFYWRTVRRDTRVWRLYKWYLGKEICIVGAKQGVIGSGSSPSCAFIRSLWAALECIRRSGVAGGGGF